MKAHLTLHWCLYNRKCYFNFIFQIVEEDGSLLEIGMFCSDFHPISDRHLILLVISVDCQAASDEK